MEQAEDFQAERPRLIDLAARILGDRAAAEDIVQQAWLRLDRADTDIESLPAWLTTVTTRLCLDRLRARAWVTTDEIEVTETAAGPADEVVLADSVGVGLQVVLDRLPPRERVAFVLHDSFGFEYSTIAAVLDTTPAAARKLASRARARIGQPAPEDHLADWEIVDAFMAAAREGDFARLISLLAPQAEVTADDAAKLLGTPAKLDGQREVAEFFNGSARAALAVYAGDRPAAAWFHRGKAMVVFDFTIAGGAVQRITFRAAPDVLAQVVCRSGQQRRGGSPVTPAGARASTGQEPAPGLVRQPQREDRS